MTSNPIKFITPDGLLAYGYEATVLADICEAVLAARNAGALQKQQEHIALQCEILVRGFARVGIIALVDEATGYQDARARDALAKILEAFVAKELQPYVKMFPPEYFKKLYRLKNLAWPPKGNKMPRYFGRITKDIVYSRSAPGLLRKFDEVNPRNENGYRKKKNTQWLTDDVGPPKLLEHLAVVVAFMQASETGDYDGFLKLLNRARAKQIEMPLFDPPPPLKSEAIEPK